MGVRESGVQDSAHVMRVVGQLHHARCYGGYAFVCSTYEASIAIASGREKQPNSSSSPLPIAKSARGSDERMMGRLGTRGWVQHLLVSEERADWRLSSAASRSLRGA